MKARIATLFLIAGCALLAQAPAARAETDKKADPAAPSTPATPAPEDGKNDDRSDPSIPPAPPGPPSDEERKPHAKPVEGKVYTLSIPELGNFQYDQEKGGNIPKDVTALTGTTVRLTGFMIPLDQADKIKAFVLVPDLFACCFGQAPQVQHSVTVNCPEGKAVSYFPEQIQVEGKLSVEEKKDDGFIISIFEVECSSVKPAPK
jgi:hypothetical protein